MQLLFSGELQIQIDRGDEIAAGYRRNRVDLILNAATTVDYNLTVTVFATQVVVVGLLDTA
jgi:hypothetical protein